MANAKLVTLPAKGVTYAYKFQVAGQTYRGSTGHQDHASAHDFAVALKKQIVAQNVMASIGKGLVPNVKRDLSLLYVAEEFWRLQGRRDIRSTTTKTIMGRVVNEVGPDTMMSEITALSLSEFVASLTDYRTSRGRPYQGSTINQYIRMLRRIHTFAGNRARGKLGLPLPILDWADVWQPERVRVRELTREEEEQMVSDGSSYAEMARFAALCGLRKTNLVTLRWSQVDFERRQITVEQKRSKATKRANRPHIIHITREMCAILKAQLPHKEAGEGQVWTLESDRTGYNAKAKRWFYRGQRTPMRVAGFDRWFKSRARKLGLDITIHDLRRTTGGRILSATGSIAFASRVLGHSSPEITARIYAHALPADLRKAMELAASGTPLWGTLDEPTKR